MTNKLTCSFPLMSQAGRFCFPLVVELLVGAAVVFVLPLPAVTLVLFGAALVSEVTLVLTTLLEPFRTAVTGLGPEMFVAGFFTVALGANLARLAKGSFCTDKYY